MKKFRTVARIAALTLALSGAGVAGSTGASAEAVTCEDLVIARTDVTAALAASACDALADGTDLSVTIPTLVMAWTTFGATSEDSTVASAGWPIKASCLIVGAVTSPTTAYYVLAGEADTAGPATATRITCSASPSGLTFSQTLPGPAAAGFDVTTSLFPGSALASQRICTLGEAWYLIRPLYMQTRGGLGDCSPSL